MKKSRSTETHIVEILNEAEAGTPAKDLCRKHGISSPTVYKRKARYGGLAVQQLKSLKEVESELAQYKKMQAELTHENYALKELIVKKLQVVLNGGNSNATLVKLDGAYEKLEDRRPDTTANKMRAIANQVKDFVRTGKLSAKQAELLLVGAHGIVDQP